jgi:hypothetical protein
VPLADRVARVRACGKEIVSVAVGDLARLQDMRVTLDGLVEARRRPTNLIAWADLSLEGRTTPGLGAPGDSQTRVVAAPCGGPEQEEAVRESPRPGIDSPTCGAPVSRTGMGQTGSATPLSRPTIDGRGGPVECLGNERVSGR